MVRGIAHYDCSCGSAHLNYNSSSFHGAETPNYPPARVMRLSKMMFERTLAYVCFFAAVRVKRYVSMRVLRLGAKS